MRGGSGLTKFPNHRFAVGTFEHWEHLYPVLPDLEAGGSILDSFNYLALQRVLGELSRDRLKIQELPFHDNLEPIVCTCGPVADRLTERFRSGARSLKEALSLWLIPRHAAHFHQAVEGGKIALWVQLADADHEKQVSQVLLARSSNGVAVHELGAPPSRTP
jgi:hypothetical protein